jgi:hypothetical protein
MVPYVPRPQRGPSVKAGLFRKDEFLYDAATDSYVCPAGQRLHPYSSSLLRGLKKINYVNKLARDDCSIRPRCTAGTFRTVSCLENEAVGPSAQSCRVRRSDGRGGGLRGPGGDFLAALGGGTGHHVAREIGRRTEAIFLQFGNERLVRPINPQCRRIQRSSPRREFSHGLFEFRPARRSGGGPPPYSVRRAHGAIQTKPATSSDSPGCYTPTRPTCRSNA